MDFIVKATDTNFTDAAIEAFNMAVYLVYEVFSDAFSGEVWGSDPLYAIFCLFVVVISVVFAVATLLSLIGSFIPDQCDDD